jgi:ankyrin repeat protein
MKSIHKAIEDGALTAVIDILESDPSQLEARNRLNDTPLHAAARRLQRDIVDFLLRKGADVNALGNQDYTPLHYVAQEDAPELAILLIQNGAQLETKDRQGQTPLQWACRAAPAVAEVLVQKGAKVDLNCAIRLRDVKRVRRLLKRKGKLTSFAIVPQELLEDAIFARNQEIVDLLMAYDKHPTPLELARPASLLFSAIQQAMFDCDTTILRKLLEHGAPVEVANERGESLLQFIRKFQTGGGGSPSQEDIKQEIVRLLEERGARA